MQTVSRQDFSTIINTYAFIISSEILNLSQLQSTPPGLSISTGPARVAYGHHANVDTGTTFLDVHTRDVLGHDVGICRG